MDYKTKKQCKKIIILEYIQYVYFWLDYIIIIFNIKKKVKYQNIIAIKIGFLKDRCENIKKLLELYYIY